MEPTEQEQNAFWEAMDSLPDNPTDEELDAALNALPEHIREWGIKDCEIFISGGARRQQPEG